MYGKEKSKKSISKYLHNQLCIMKKLLLNLSPLSLFFLFENLLNSMCIFFLSKDKSYFKKKHSFIYLLL